VTFRDMSLVIFSVHEIQDSILSRIAVSMALYLEESAYNKVSEIRVRRST
jgi:hypothetical protein